MGIHSLPLEHLNSSSDLWKTLKSLETSSKLKSCSTSIGLDVDGSATSDKLKVADTFNAFFTTVANKLVSKLQMAVNILNSKFIHQYYKQKGVIQNAFSFSLLSETEVCKMLKGLSPRKASGLDDLPTRFIRDGAEGIAYPISYNINLSLKTGVYINGTFSKPRMVPCGVPQGSILGPLLFLIYVNDMESAVKCKLILYADDSALLVSGKDVKVIQETLGKELCALSSWLLIINSLYIWVKQNLFYLDHARKSATHHL